MSELSDLVTLLYPKTMEGKLQWVFDGEDRMYTIQGRNQVELNQISEDDFLLKVRNKDGISIVENHYYSGDTYEKLHEIFRKERRSAFKVDETLIDLSNHIKAL